MRFTSVFSFASVLLLTACAAPKYNYMPVTTAISEPPIDSVNTTQVGDTMVRQGKYQEYDAIYVTRKADPSWAYTLYPGYYLKQGEDETAEYYYPGGGDESGRVVKSGLADPWTSIMTKKGDTEICVVTVFNAYVCGDSNSFERRKKLSVTHDSFQQSLIYSGKVGNKINIGYREFSNNLARPAFNNNVEYDLSESKTIAYKGAKLEILEATNQNIKYKVLSNFNKAIQ
ncbi:MAG: hypothetical protein FPO08_05225 [Geobacter sp.]|nr:MAG: hypothetical protein FPO08_05225 [Geobacter sp.]